MKVAIIGSSHAACIKTGWELVKNELGETLSPSFFAIGINYFPFFEEGENGVFELRPNSEDTGGDARQEIEQHAERINGVNRINLAEFDAICLVGFFSGIDIVWRFLAQVSVWDGSLAKETQKTLISNQTKIGILSDLQREAIKKWPLKSLGSRKVFALPAPFPFEKIFDGDVGRGLGARVKSSLLTNPTYVTSVQDYIRELQELMSNELKVELLEQPQETISEFAIISSNDFCKGAQRLGGISQPPSDFSHANEEYGAAFWRHFFSILKGKAE